MRAEIIPFEITHALQILGMPGMRDYAPVPDKDRIAYLRNYRAAGPAYTLMVDDVPIVSGGVILLDWRNGTAWSIPSPLVRKYKIASYRAIRWAVFDSIHVYRLKRVEALVDPSFEAGRRMVERMGFKDEGVKRNYGPNGEDFAIYAKITKGGT